MKILYIVFFFLFSISLQAQNIARLKFGTTLAINNVDIEFIKILEDSRCPTNVNCVRAGKAIVLVNVYVDGNFIEESKLKFYPSGFSNDSVNTLFNTDGLRISGLNLIPYPVTTRKTALEDYFLELAIN